MKALLLAFVLLLVSCVSPSSQDKGPVAGSGYAGIPIQSCDTDLRYLNQVLGWQGEWPSKWQAVVANGPKDADKKINNWRFSPQAITSAIDELRLGVKKGETAPRAVVLRVQQQVADLSIHLLASNSKYIFSDVSHPNALNWNHFIKKDLAPAVVEFDRFLRDEYLAKANVSPGLSAINDGSTCFYNSVAWWTSLNLTQDEIEAIGWRYLKETREDLLKTGNEGEDVNDILNRLRVASKSNTTSPEDLIRISENALNRADKKLHLAFSHEVTQDIVVTKLPKHLQAAFPAGRYAGRQIGSSTASYIINPSRPNERRLMAEVIAFHEGIPGHHLWMTYPRPTLKLKYHTGLSGLLEGWAIYTEYLADEMGLYSTTFDRQGMIAKHLWAASRLIVEPGLHLRGWSRKKAINFMLENTVMSRAEIEIEVDRYIAMPGQSLSYILGADVILSERKRAKEMIGDDFDIKAFHDVVLIGGARPLSVLRDDIRAWVSATVNQDA